MLSGKIDKDRLPVEARRFRLRASLAVKGKAFSHRLEILAGLHHPCAETRKIAGAVDIEPTGPQVLSRHIGLHDGVVAIGRVDARGQGQRILDGMAMRIGKNANLGAEPVGLHEPARCPFNGTAWRDESAVPGKRGRRRSDAQRVQHGTRAELVLTEREQRILAADPPEHAEACKGGRNAAAEVGDAVGQRPDQGFVRSIVREICGERIQCRSLEPDMPFGACLIQCVKFRLHIDGLRQIGCNLTGLLYRMAFGDEPPQTVFGPLMYKHQRAVSHPRAPLSLRSRAIRVAASAADCIEPQSVQACRKSTAGRRE